MTQYSCSGQKYSRFVSNLPARKKWRLTGSFFSKVVTALIASVFGAATQASLVDRGGGLIYDSDRNITWLANANLAATETFGVTGIGGPGLYAGLMSWETAKAWIASMNTANYLGHNDWRLPETIYPDASCIGTPDNQLFAKSYGCSGSEMGHLFYSELGGVAGEQIGTTHNGNFSLFSNLASSQYWSGTDMPISWSVSGGYLAFANSGYIFNFYNGVQGGLGGGPKLYAMAVRDGDTSPVPVPAALWLFGSGLAALAGLTRRKHRR